MNRNQHPISQAFVAFLLLLIIAACRDDTFDAQGLTPDGRVHLTLGVELPDADVVATRLTTQPTADERIIDPTRTYLLVLQAPADLTAGATDGLALKQAPVPIESIDLATGQLRATLYPETTASYLCLLANLSAANVDYLHTLSAGSVTLGEIRQALRLPHPGDGMAANNLPLTGYSAPLPTIQPTATLLSAIRLERSVARIDLVTSPTLSGFQLTGVILANAPRQGAMLPDGGRVESWHGEEVCRYALVPTTDYDAASGTGSHLTAALYAYEKGGVRADGTTPNPTRLLLRGHHEGATTDTYYPYDLIYRLPTDVEEVKRYDLLRNKRYRITLQRITTSGYRTPEEALTAEPFNTPVEVQVEVTDPYAHDINTNGRQYLATTNARCILYPLDGNEQRNVHIATLSYTTAPEWLAGRLTLTAVDANGTVLNGFRLSDGSDALEVASSGAVVYRDLVVDIPARFHRGTVTAHIGNLRKEITLVRKIPSLEAGMVIEDYLPDDATPEEVAQHFADYKIGEVIAPSVDTKWLKVSAQESNAGPSSLLDRVTNPTGGIYVHVLPYVEFGRTLTHREAAVYVSGSTDDSRTKVIVQQGAMDIYSQSRQLQPFGYVGTFHRWNQTGERLIRMDASGSFDEVGARGTVWWQAAVVAGNEFIVLDTEPTRDSGITIFSPDGTVNAFGDTPCDEPTWQTDAEIETNGQLTSKRRLVRGNSPQIYFRVGLTSRLASADSPPRYGLIAITYGSADQPAAGTHLLYVRQGEAADYLMRPQDASTQPIYPAGHQQAGQINTARTFDFDSPNRPLAVKLSPYNLTDKLRGTGVVNRGTRNYGFVQYPSQGGYYFSSASTYAVDPRSVGALKLPSVDRLDATWNQQWESCPDGYRRPNDGPLHTAPNIGASNFAHFLSASEIRQSLWLYPLGGVQRSDFSNQLRGYLADGFFDRRPITLTADKIIYRPPGSTSTGNTYPMQARGVVNDGAAEAAYWGYLLYNPHNYASIFVPFAGDVSILNSSVVRDQGSFGGFFTTNIGSGKYSPKPGVEVTFSSSWKTLMVQYGFSGADLTSSTALSGFVFDNYGISSPNDYFSVRCVKEELNLKNKR